MINSREIDDLHPTVQVLCRRFLVACDRAGIDILVTSTYRDSESQAEIYAQGRTKPGRVVTKAPPGYSFHNYRLAFDVVPLRAGKPVWGTRQQADLAVWMKVGAIGRAAGLEWAGDWSNNREFPHFQYTGGLTIKDLLHGKRLA